MDTMGDAETSERDEELWTPRQPWLTSEALAVTSLAMAMGSLFVTGVSQYVVFVLADTLGLSNGSNQQGQVALFMAPVAIMSLTAVAAGVAALKRRSDDRWASALAIAGVAVGAVILLVAGGAILAAWIHDPASISG
jgi:hypothetical protein